MSSRYAQSDYDLSESRPDKPLVVKCNYEGVNKRITFISSRICTYDLLRSKVEQCFSLLPANYAITYTDDDGETTDITTDNDLTEAIRYFHPGGEDPPVSSAASILSGRSFGRGKITLRVKVSVDYDGPSLSDTSSLASMDDFEGRNGSEFSLSLSGSSPREVEDDSVTVSSKDMGSKYDVYRARGGPRTIVSGPSREPLIRRPQRSQPSYTEERNGNDWDSETVSSIPQTLSLSGSSLPSIQDRDEREHEQSVFENLKRQEMRPAEGPSHSSPLLQGERGAAWLRDQSSRTPNARLGSDPAQSDMDNFSLNDTRSIMSGELALQKDPKGKFYYAYTSGITSSGPSTDEASSVVYDADLSGGGDSVDLDDRGHRPTSRDMRWLHEQSALTVIRGEPPLPSTSNGHHVNHRSYSEPVLSRDDMPPDIPPELLPFLSMPPDDPLPPPNPTDCSNCGVVLDMMRYVCAMCGEKDSAKVNGVARGVKGKGKDLSPGSSSSDITYPPSPHPPSSSASASSWTLLASDHENPFHDSKAINKQKPLPALPPTSSSPMSSPSSLTIPGAGSGSGFYQEAGYELCYTCFGSVGVVHALESCIAPGSSPKVGEWPPSSPEDAQRALSAWRRTASAKGQLRHAYIEKTWGSSGWANVEHDDHLSVKCSTCSTTIVGQRYKCAMCYDFNLCKACYSQVHEIHPSHAFLVVLEVPIRSHSEPLVEHPTLTPDETGELSMTHPGVKCFHCLQDIVGARFHCAICTSVDICSNCESAGLPGNLDSSDDGHNSAHIMIKIPYPLPEEELESASLKAKQLWRQDAPSVDNLRPRSRRGSLVSTSYARTVMGHSSGSLTSLPGSHKDEHGISCNQCRLPIAGVRFQCAMCPSNPESYNLCAHCEARSYAIHDPMHIFFKLPRPVDKPLEWDFTILPILYRIPAGPPGGTYNRERPKEYLRDLTHTAAFCDRCMERITGEWFRCVYCAKDLCDTCEAVDTHNNTHFFMVIKSLIDMAHFKRFAHLDDESRPVQPIVPYPVYRS